MTPEEIKAAQDKIAAYERYLEKKKQYEEQARKPVPDETLAK